MVVFAKVIDEGSISAAAAALGVSKSVVSQQLKLLENELGMALLKRTTRKQSLTAAGERFYVHCRNLNGIAEEAWMQAQDTLKVPQGRITITASNALMDALVVPAITALMPKYPLLRPRLISNDQQLNIAEEDIDLAIRVGSSEDSSLKQKRIGEFRDILCGHAERCIEIDKANVPYIANDWQTESIYHKFKSKQDGDDFVYKTQATSIANSYHTCLALIKSKVGIGVIPDFLFEKHQHQHELVEVFPEYQLALNPIYALYPYPKHVPLSVSVILAEIESALKVRSNGMVEG